MTDHNQSSTPYADALAGFAQRDLTRLFIPGHAASNEAAPLVSSYFGSSVLDRDVSMLISGLDCGEHNPLAHSLALAADAFHASRAWFLTNGASQGNHLAALTLGLLGREDQPVLAQRSAHSSFIDGVVLADLNPVFLQPSIDLEHGINHGLTVTAVTRALAANPDAKAVFVLSPSYFGAVADIPGIAAAAHAAGVPLIVDAAWGSHFGFSPLVPANPLDQGADLVITSNHKLGGSLTQSAMLLLGHGPHARALEPLIDRAYTMTASTSMSSLLIASLDLARADLVMTGEQRIAQALEQADTLRDAVRAHPDLAVVSDGFSRFDDIVTFDALRVSIDVRGLGRSGHYLREELGTRHGIYTEISTENCLVAFVGPGYRFDTHQVIGALEDLAGDRQHPSSSIPAMPAPGPVAVRPRAAFFAPSTTVTADQAIGRVSAASLAAYPPGIPNVLPGEVITAETVQFLQAVADSEMGYVRGALDPKVTTFQVLA